MIEEFRLYLSSEKMEPLAHLTTKRTDHLNYEKIQLVINQLNSDNAIDCIVIQIFVSSLIKKLH
jgi:hypothetical protein